MSVKEVTCYLAGAMSGLSFEEMNNWRRNVKNVLLDYANTTKSKLTVINPVEYFNFEDLAPQNEREARDFDLRTATSSDFIIVLLRGLNTSIGTAIELHDCYYHKKIPVYGLGTQEEFENLHPWLKEEITRYATDVFELAEYIGLYWLT